MPIIYRGTLRKVDFEDRPLTKMTMRELIDYEKCLWRWMATSPPNIVQVLNAIYREVEWRAQDTNWRKSW